jgi:hypothetical protein
MQEMGTKYYRTRSQQTCCLDIPSHLTSPWPFINITKAASRTFHSWHYIMTPSAECSVVMSLCAWCTTTTQIGAREMRSDLNPNRQREKRDLQGCLVLVFLPNLLSAKWIKLRATLHAAEASSCDNWKKTKEPKLPPRSLFLKTSCCLTDDFSHDVNGRVSCLLFLLSSAEQSGRSRLHPVLAWFIQTCWLTD